MSDETQEVEVEDSTDVEVEADDRTEDEILADLIAEDEAAEDAILGATPAEEAPEEPAPEPEKDVRAEIHELLDQGYTLPQLEILTNAKGTPISVKVA